MATQIKLAQLIQDGAADGQVIAWNDTAGFWEPTTSGAGNGIYGGSDFIALSAVATVQEDSSFEVDYFNDQYAIYVEDQFEGGGLYLSNKQDTHNINLTFSGTTLRSNLHSDDSPTSILFDTPTLSGADQTTGTLRFLRSTAEFKPTSGTSTFTDFELNPTINQTGGASGATFGIKINPTLTAVGSGGFTGLSIAASGQTALHTTAGLVKFDLGSDASYDTIYRGTNGALTRLANGTNGQVLTATTSGAPSWQDPPVGGDILNGGNTFGSAITIGTNDNWDVNFEQNGTVAMTILASKNIQIINSVAATNTITNRFVIRTNSTGTAAANFGGAIKFEGESSTTNNRDMGRLSSYWATATDASRLSAFSISGYNVSTENTLLTLTGTGAARLNQYGSGTFTGTAAYALQVDASGNIIEGTVSGGGGDISNGGNTFGSAITIGTNDAFGLNLETNGTTRISMTSAGEIDLGQAAAQRILLRTSAASSSGGVELSTTAQSNTTDVGFKITGPAYTLANANNKTVQITNTYTRSSGSGFVTTLAINPTINISSTASTSAAAIDISPTLTSLSGTFYGLYMNFNNSNAFGIYQSGSSTSNVFGGKMAVGSVTAPTETFKVTGDAAITSNLTVEGQYASTRHAITDGVDPVADWNNGNVQTITVQANRTFTFSNPKSGGRYLLFITQGSGGSKLITWPTIKWRGGTAPTLTTAAGKIDIITLVYDGSSYYGDASLNY